MLQAQHLSISRQNTLLLQDINCQIATNQLVALVGHNGSGKSTLIKTLAGEMLPSSGSLVLEDRPLSDYGSKDLAKKLAYLPQQLPDAASFSVSELVMLGRYPHQKWLQKPSQIDRDKVTEAMHLTQVAPFADRIVSTLSGGERARVWLAMCLAQDTQYLLLDEPLAALDVRYQLEVMALIRQMVDTQGLGVAMIVHDINLAAQYADRIVALKAGKICHDDTVANIMQPDVLKDIFNVDMQLLTHPVNGQPVAVV
ncbi:ABC transporter ATP-binding protein [Psychrobacter sp. YP14]|uniref:ABC transporter ATP-binding protein n=1 Tax=Psychrobacter sp. YP14 TaxID=2203895 RepID=UPI000D7E3573|nr:ABC transporter ATP-binding protein [Psychrobacter sp. YP14]AWT49037.1 ABC transporter ATP-binding protein [Psychrobacter sp. YP14]